MTIWDVGKKIYSHLMIFIMKSEKGASNKIEILFFWLYINQMKHQGK